YDFSISKPAPTKAKPRNQPMSTNGLSRLPELLKQHEPEILSAWVQEQKGVISHKGQIKDAELRSQCAEFLGHLRHAAQGNNLTDADGPQWGEVRDLLTEVSRTRGLQGFSPAETATFVFSLKKPLFALLRREYAKDPEGLARETWLGTELLDRLG